MPVGDPKYNAAQRDALELNYVDRGVPGPTVVKMAAAGELLGRDEQAVPAFTVPINTVRSMGRKTRRRRQGRDTSPLSEKVPRDAIENLRRRLVNLADRELAVLEKRRAGAVEPEKMRQVARVVLELARLPGPSDPRVPSRGTRDADGNQGPQTKAGLAGPLLKAHRLNGAGEATAQDAQHVHHDDGERTAASGATQPSSTEHRADAEDEPGAWTRRRMAELPSTEQPSAH